MGRPRPHCSFRAKRYIGNAPHKCGTTTPKPHARAPFKVDSTRISTNAVHQWEWHTVSGMNAGARLPHQGLSAAPTRHLMSLATVQSRALDGLAAAPVTVEVHLANGLPSFTVVGLRLRELDQMLYIGALALVSGTLQRSFGLSVPLASLPKATDLKLRVDLCKAAAPLSKASNPFLGATDPYAEPRKVKDAQAKATAAAATKASDASALKDAAVKLKASAAASAASAVTRHLRGAVSKLSSGVREAGYH